jgi:hypothetical protein
VLTIGIIGEFYAIDGALNAVRMELRTSVDALSFRSFEQALGGKGK